MTAVTDEIVMSKDELTEHFRSMVVSLKAERDSLMCCGNCKHAFSNNDELDCAVVYRDIWSDDEFSIYRNSPACAKWESNMDNDQ